MGAIISGWLTQEQAGVHSHASKDAVSSAKPRPCSSCGEPRDGNEKSYCKACRRVYNRLYNKGLIGVSHVERAKLRAQMRTAEAPRFHVKPGAVE